MNGLYDDPGLYDLQHAGYRDDLAFYRRLAEDQAGPVLELGAGTGRVTLALAALGLPVVAVEPHPAMRSRAAERLASAAASDPGITARVRLLAGDARSLVLDERFALVLAPFNTLMHLERLEDQDSALALAREHLASGGAFACDVYSPRFAQAGLVRAEVVRTELGERADLLVWQQHDPVQQLVVSESRLDEAGADGLVRRRRATLRQRYYQRYELERALRAAGFADVRCYGDFDRGPVREASSVWAFIARP